jgi:lipoprotein-anchoring transpeptidase ErfK/SrfK
MGVLRLPLLLTAALIVSPPTASAEILITIDKATQRMTVAVDGAERWTWPISTGRRGYATPSGRFTAFRLEKDHYSREWDDAPMPHSIFFTRKGHAIHGSYEIKHLGRPASHGCVRLHPGNAAKLFALVERRGVTDATVVVTDGEGNRRRVRRVEQGT